MYFKAYIGCGDFWFAPETLFVPFVLSFCVFWGILRVCYHVIRIYSVIISCFIPDWRIAVYVFATRFHLINGHFIYARETRVSYICPIFLGGAEAGWVSLPNPHQFHFLLCPRFRSYSRTRFQPNLHRSHVRSSNLSRSFKIPTVHEPPCWSVRPPSLAKSCD